MKWPLPVLSFIADEATNKKIAFLCVFIRHSCNFISYRSKSIIKLLKKTIANEEMQHINYKQ